MSKLTPSAKPRLAIVSTGGTIAMTADAPGSGGTIKLGAAGMAALAPGLADWADVTAIDAAGVPSASFTLADLVRISDTVRRAAGEADGVVVTHGTDVLEETAFMLALTLGGLETPVVLTGAMRRPDQLGFEGAANLTASARVALSAEARGKGVLVVADDEIHWAGLVRKVHSFRTHAFSSAPFGPLGWVAEDRVRFVLAPAQGLPALAFGPRPAAVPILEAGPAFEVEVLRALMAAPLDALVLSLPGAGHVSAEAVPLLAELNARVPVIFATRTGAGETLRSSYGFAGGEMDLLARGLIGAGALDPRKARIAALLLASDGADRARFAEVFAAF